MQSVQVVPFLPNGSNTVTISATSASSSTAITAPGSPLNPEQPGTVRVYNKGTDLVFINFSKGAGSAAVASDMPVPSGNTEIFWVPNGADHINVICASTTATVYATPGWGT